MVVPVWLFAKSKPNREILIYALLDKTSDTTFVTNETASELQAKGHQTILNLSKMADKNVELECQVHNDLMVRGYKPAEK